MKRIRGGAVVAAALGVLVAGSAAIPAAHAGIPLDRWASPAGTTDNTCADADPCDLVTAINDAPANSTVHVLPGQYGSASEPIATTLDPSTGTSIEGTSVVSPPVIFESGEDQDAALLSRTGTVSDLTLMSTAPIAGLDLLDGSTARRVAVYAAAGSDGACSVDNSTLSESLCAQTGDFLPAIGLSGTGSGTETSSFKNITAVASGAHSAGLSSEASGGGSMNLSVTSSILEGKQFDLNLSASDGSALTVTLDHSLYRPAMVTNSGATLVADSTAVTAKAMFINRTTGDFREKHTSPSIDRGRKATPGDTDLAGNSRTLGKTTDIGAYEFLPRPVVGHLKLVKVEHHVGTFLVKANPEGLTTHLRLVARHKLHEVKSEPLNLGDGRKAQHLRIRFDLDPGTTYHVRAHAKSKGGVTQSNNTHFVT